VVLTGDPMRSGDGGRRGDQGVFRWDPTHIGGGVRVAPQHPKVKERSLAWRLTKGGGLVMVRRWHNDAPMSEQRRFQEHLLGTRELSNLHTRGVC
jgi:hypothetical protein